MLEGKFAYALVVGMVATVNPCGFALLPAYLTTFVGLEQRPNRMNAVLRAIAVSLALTAGFATVFGLVGMVFGSALDEVLDRAPWFTIVIGLLLVALGVYMLTGRQLNPRIPKLQLGGSDATLVSMYLYGVSYAVASLSCSIATFAAATSSASTGNFVSRLLTFLLYAAGMGLVIGVLTVAVALAKAEIVTHFRNVLPYIGRIAGALTVIAGAYVAYYGWYEYDLIHRNGDPDDPVIDLAARIQRRLLDLMPNTGNYGWYVVGALALIGAAVAWAWRTPKQTA